IPKFEHEEEILNKIPNKGVPNKFNVISMNELKEIGNNLKNTSGVEDGISTRILKDATEVIANRLLDVMNSFLNSGVFPYD
ncbi:hypothetical protein HHI36_006446, partial [Cryptolaemus montrouzieri]